MSFKSRLESCVLFTRLGCVGRSSLDVIRGRVAPFWFSLETYKKFLGCFNEKHPSAP